MGVQVAMLTRDNRTTAERIAACLGIGNVNLWWAAGYNTVAFPIAAGVLYPSLGLVLRPEIGTTPPGGSGGGRRRALLLSKVRWVRCGVV